MKKLMFLFLDEMNPEMFILKTKFGNIPKYGREGNYCIGDEKHNQVKKLCEYFTLGYFEGLKTYDEWLNKKPILQRKKNLIGEVEFVSAYDTNY